VGRSAFRSLRNAIFAVPNANLAPLPGSLALASERRTGPWAIVTVANRSPSSFCAERFAIGGSAQRPLRTPTRILRGKHPKASAVNSRPSASRRSETCPRLWPGVETMRKPETTSPSRRILPTGNFGMSSMPAAMRRKIGFLGGAGGSLPEMTNASYSVAPSSTWGAHSVKPSSPPM
jgi:hypothetical protein